MLASRMCVSQQLYLRAPSCRLVARSPSVVRSRRLQQVHTHAQPDVVASYHLLQYQYVPDILEKRGPHRAAHLSAAQAKADAGHIVLAGAVGSPPSGATFVFKNQTPEEIKGFVESDPYVKAGLVTSWEVQPWTVVVKGISL